MISTLVKNLKEKSKDRRCWAWDSITYGTVLVKTWVYLKLSSAEITQKYFNNTHRLPLSPPDKVTNPKACLAATQTSNSSETDVIESIDKAIIAPAEM